MWAQFLTRYMSRKTTQRRWDALNNGQQRTKYTRQLNNKRECIASYISLNQNVSHGFNMLIPIISAIYSVSVVATCIRIVMISSSAEPDPGITRVAISVLVTKDTDSCFRACSHGTFCVEAFLVTGELQGGIRTNYGLPLVTTQWGAAVLPISDQWIQGTGALSDFNKIDLVVDLHTEADLGEGCVPVGGKFGFLWVKPSLSSINIKGVFILPVCRGVVERWLWEEHFVIHQKQTIALTYIQCKWENGYGGRLKKITDQGLTYLDWIKALG